MSHRDTGLLALLKKASNYRLLQRLLLRAGTRRRVVRDILRPFPGCRILDIGCGPADILEELPKEIGAYHGFDMNPEYIEAARSRWGERGRFECQRVDEAALPEGGSFDIVLATGILHHLDDAEAARLFAVADHALRPGGWLVTYDNVYIENQNPVARWLIARDRGQAVRTREGYEALARRLFPKVESTVLHDTLRLPYTILVMRCVREAGPQA
jgi:SAM-dependent methyltransferase